jgi:hypothetical protein
MKKFQDMYIPDVDVKTVDVDVETNVAELIEELCDATDIKECTELHCKECLYGIGNSERFIDWLMHNLKNEEEQP